MSGWVRLWSDMPTDPKWRVIARASGQRIGDVIAVFNMLMVEAGKADEKGRVDGLKAEDIAAALDMEEGEISAILAAYNGRVTLNGFLKGWNKRQPKREDDSSTRVKDHRERLKLAETSQNKDVTQRNAPEADSDTDTEVESKDEATPHSAPRLPVTEAASLWNETAAQAGWQTVKRLSDPRKAALRARLREEGFEGWEAAIAKARASPFLGRDPPTWFTFDWIIKPANFLKLIEGNYDRRHEDNRGGAGAGGRMGGPRPDPTLALVRAATAAEAADHGNHREAWPALPPGQYGRS